MEFVDVVRKRRMVRHFTDEPVPVETVERIVRMAQHAPSAGFSQGVSFVLVTDPQTRHLVGICGSPALSMIGVRAVSAALRSSWVTTRAGRAAGADRSSPGRTSSA